MSQGLERFERKKSKGKTRGKKKGEKGKNEDGDVDRDKMLNDEKTGDDATIFVADAGADRG